ncbi:MAG TPA: hypothetical protein VEY67_09450 [Candidatus Dormibacteraeota bacterium]|nr:hypothetical protein [Candidatus Dormibacteraeota bacterium]
MSHPSLGLPPSDMSAGHPGAAARLTASKARLGARALEIALDRDPTLATRSSEAGLRHLLRDTDILIDRLARCVASGEAFFLASFADQVVPVYRRRRVPLDDVANLIESIGIAAASLLSAEERATADAAVAEAVKVLKWHRRLAGDARRRNPILAALYRGG